MAVFFKLDGLSDYAAIHQLQAELVDARAAGGTIGTRVEGRDDTRASNETRCPRDVEAPDDEDEAA